MRCNLQASRLRTTFLAVAILVPSLVAVNHFTKKSVDMRADGIPIPPLPPPKGFTLVADGIPIPPLPPPKGTTLAADGIPIPPLPPPKGDVVSGLSV
ncbi:MAG TPA: hypothetical protein VFP96_14785 [Candidatus Acidoferrum sp.]|nr:hypothetical protein [Candidatus Acidoferrum sp.]